MDSLNSWRAIPPGTPAVQRLWYGQRSLPSRPYYQHPLFSSEVHAALSIVPPRLGLIPALTAAVLIPVGWDRSSFRPQADINHEIMPSDEFATANTMELHSLGWEPHGAFDPMSARHEYSHANCALSVENYCCSSLGGTGIELITHLGAMIIRSFVLLSFTTVCNCYSVYDIRVDGQYLHADQLRTHFRH